MVVPSRIIVYVLADDLAGLNNPFIAQHGASYWLKIMYSDNEEVNILFDTGTYSEPIIGNMERLGLKPHDIDYVVISHNHYDHTGGLLGVLDKIGHMVPVIAPSSLGKASIHIGERLRIITAPIYPGRFLEEIITRKGYPLLIDDPVKIVNGVWTTGVFDHCSENNETFYVEKGRLIPDTLCDELSLVIDLGSYGVVITGCAHPGITRIVEKASKIIGKKIEVVVGGLHLVGYEEPRLRTIAEELREMGVEKIYPGHCTGLDAEYILKKIYGDNCVVLRAGMKIVFSR